MKVAILGAGAWGTALAISAAARHEVLLWARDAAQAAAMQRERGNARYLPGAAWPANLAATYSKLGQHSLALAHRQRALQILLTYPPSARVDLPTLYAMVAHDLLELNRPSEAIQYLDAAMKLNPNDPDVIQERDRAMQASAQI